MRYFFLTYALLIVFVVSIFGFHGDKFKKPPIRIFPDMDDQDYIGAQSKTDFFSDGLGSRKPVVNTNPIGHSQDLTLQQELNTRGQEVYNYKCAICHAESGNGKGITSEYGWVGIADLTASALPEGGIYDVMVNGKGKMGQQGRDLTLYDRWAVIAYIKILQQAAK